MSSREHQIRKASKSTSVQYVNGFSALLAFPYKLSILNYYQLKEQYYTVFSLHRHCKSQRTYHQTKDCIGVSLGTYFVTSAVSTSSFNDSSTKLRNVIDQEPDEHMNINY
eukprot:4851312-Amphidinium_carterae.1